MNQLLKSNFEETKMSNIQSKFTDSLSIRQAQFSIQVFQRCRGVKYDVYECFDVRVRKLLSEFNTAGDGSFQKNKEIIKNICASSNSASDDNHGVRRLYINSPRTDGSPGKNHSLDLNAKITRFVI